MTQNESIQFHSSSYISHWESCIVSLRHKGLSFAEISHKLSSEEEKVRQDYLAAVNKIKLLYSAAHLPHTPPCDTIPQFLDFIGIQASVKGRLEMEAALCIAQKSPELLGDLSTEFYPTLAAYLGTNTNRVTHKLRMAIRHSFYHKDETDAQAFFNEADIVFVHNLSMKKFLKAATAYIEKNSMAVNPFSPPPPSEKQSRTPVAAE